MATTESVQTAMRTRYCEYPACRDEAEGKGQWCAKHRQALGGAPASSAPAPIVKRDTGQPQQVIYRCKDPDCAEVVRSSVGPYCYCQKHRDERGIPTGAGRHTPGRIGEPEAPVAAPARPATEAVPTLPTSEPETHEARMRAVVLTARALDRAEARSKTAAAELRAAKKAHRDALAIVAGGSGVSLTGD